MVAERSEAPAVEESLGAQTRATTPNPSFEKEGRSFSLIALQLCGQCALLLGWRPDEFWGTTPAELACILNAMTAQTETPPDAGDLQKLMELFPDAPTGGDQWMKR